MSYIYRRGLKPNFICDIASTSREPLCEVVIQLKDIISIYGEASLADLYDLMGMRCNDPLLCSRVGWTELDITPAYIPRIHSTTYGKCCDFTIHKLSLPATRPLGDYEDLYFHHNEPVSGDKVTIQLKGETPKFKEALPKAAKDAKIQKAYNVLTKAYCNTSATMSELECAMEEAIGYLGGCWNNGKSTDMRSLR